MNSVSKLVALKPYALKITLDSEHKIGLETYGLAIFNGRFVGGGFPIAPRARLDDGLMDLTVVPELPRLELVKVGLDYSLGRDQQADRVIGYQARKVTLSTVPEMPFSIDGEPTQSPPMTIEALKKILQIAVGERPPGLMDLVSEKFCNWIIMRRSVNLRSE